MSKQIFILQSFVFVSLLFFSCSKYTKGACQFYNPPSALFFLLKKDGQILPDTILQNVKLSYYVNGVKSYIPDLSEATDFYAGQGILATRDIGFLSIKTYYLEYPNNWNTDSLYVDYIAPSISTNCLYILDTVKFNTQLAPIDTTFKYEPVYVLNKQ
jgi:hypothetical protein